MIERRILIFGNAGSGKTTMARQVASEFDIPHLCLDDIAWGETAVRMTLSDSLAELHEFVAKSTNWVIEGCYGDLLEAAWPLCTELRFLNPGIEACIERCRNRPWEPSYCASPEEPQRFLGPLIEFVREYETRTDEYSLARHQALFDQFTGPKREYRE